MVTKKNIKQGKKQSPKAQPKAEANKANGKSKFPIIFSEWETSGHQTFRVVVDLYKGRVLSSIRKFWLDDNDELQPGKGATVGYEDIDEIIEGLKKMKVWMEEHPREE